MRLFFSVGEPSGDQHAAHLVEELRRRVPNLEVAGFGGPLMRQTGVDLLYPLTELAVMGILQVLPLIQKFRKLVRQAEAYFDQQTQSGQPVDAVVLVDFPGFNWWIARAAKRRGIPVFYYCPPQLWAWASWRIHKMRRNVDHVLCCHPFEVDWYLQRKMPAEYVGHPFYDEIAEKTLDAEFLRRHQSSSPDTLTMAVLPGSRNGEIRHNWPIQVAVMRRLAETRKNLRFLVACYREHQRDTCADYLKSQNLNLPLELHVGKTSEILELSDLCHMVSGSVSLEVMSRGKPTVVLYHVDRLFAFLAKVLVRCRWMSLPNLIAERTLMPEFPLYGNSQRGIDQMAELLGKWIDDPAELHRKTEEMRELKRRVAVTGGIARAADALLSHLPAATVVPATTVAPQERLVA